MFQINDYNWMTLNNCDNKTQMNDYNWMTLNICDNKTQTT